MKNTIAHVAALAMLVSAVPCVAVAQQTEKVNLDAMQKIRDEGFNRSQIMDIASWLTDVHGSRLTGSPAMRKAADWTVSRMKSWGISNPRTEAWGLNANRGERKFGHGWTSKAFTAQVLAPTAYPVIAYPLAWSFGTDGPKIGDVAIDVHLDSMPDLVRYRGKLRGKWIMQAPPPRIAESFVADACRYTELELSAADMNPTGPRCASGRGQFYFPSDTAGFGRGGRGGVGGAGGRGALQTAADSAAACARQAAQTAFVTALANFWATEGALGILTPSNKPYGTANVSAAGGAPDTIPKVGLPRITLIPEHYGRIWRTVEKGVPVRLEINSKSVFSPDTGSVNIIGEIPGSDPSMKDQVVMLGAHFDSWPAGTGATDNAAGSAVMLEALRILKTLNLPMKRTVRIALWTGEEQGLIGSNMYVRRAFGYVDSAGQHFTPEYARLSGYFNVDNGTGAIRGIYAERNDSAASLFKSWLDPFKDLSASTVTLSTTGGTDHQSFDRIGLPGFQFIQDPLDYDTRTHHTSMDVYERLVPHDMMQNAVIVASFVYDAATRDALLPRKPAPTTVGGRGGAGGGRGQLICRDSAGRGRSGRGVM